jgi:hypothetical protein
MGHAYRVIDAEPKLLEQNMAVVSETVLQQVVEGYLLRLVFGLGEHPPILPTQVHERAPNEYYEEQPDARKNLKPPTQRVACYEGQPDAAKNA